MVDCVQYRLLNLKCIETTGSLNLDYIEDYFAREQLNPDFLTRRGDVLIRLSFPYTTVLIDDDIFVWAIYLYDDHFTLILNAGNKNQQTLEIPLDEIEEGLDRAEENAEANPGSPMIASAPPERSTCRKAGTSFLFVFCKKGRGGSKEPRHRATVRWTVVTAADQGAQFAPRVDPPHLHQEEEASKRTRLLAFFVVLTFIFRILFRRGC